MQALELARALSLEADLVETQFPVSNGSLQVFEFGPVAFLDSHWRLELANDGTYRFFDLRSGKMHSEGTVPPPTPQPHQLEFV